MAYMDFLGPTFKLNIPTDWYIASSQKYQLVLLPPPFDGTGSGANFTVMMNRIYEKEADLNTTMVEFLDVLKDQLPDFTIIEQEPITGYEHPAHWYKATWKNPQDNPPTIYIQRQMFYLTEGVLYVITSLRPETSETQDVIKLDELFAHIFKSWTLR